MKFYDATNKQGLCQLLDDLCDTDDTSYPRVKKTRDINLAYERVVGKLINADGSWEFDDTNYSDFPIGTYTLTEGQAKYSFNDKFLQIMEVQVKDSNGDWHILQPISQREYSDETPLEEAFEDNGLPEYYDKISDDTIKLFPAPSEDDVTLTNGLKIKFKRTASTFTVASDTSEDTTEPGFAINHEILAYMAAIPYCMKYKKDRVPLYKKTADEMMKELLDHYGQREKDVRKKLGTKPIKYK